MNKINRETLACEQRKKLKREKKLFYKGTQFTSFFEKEVAMYLDQLKIEWIRNEIAFPALMEDGRTLHFTPDFFLPDINCFLETKGTWWTSAKRKKTFLAAEQNNIRFICLMLKDWQRCKKILRYKIEDIKNAYHL